MLRGEFKAAFNEPAHYEVTHYSLIFFFNNAFFDVPSNGLMHGTKAFFTKYEKERYLEGLSNSCGSAEELL